MLHSWFALPDFISRDGLQPIRGAFNSIDCGEDSFQECSSLASVALEAGQLAEGGGEERKSETTFALFTPALTQ
jgi:hypothetical protein